MINIVSDSLLFWFCLRHFCLINNFSLINLTLFCMFTIIYFHLFVLFVVNLIYKHVCFLMSMWFDKLIIVLNLIGNRFELFVFLFWINLMSFVSIWSWLISFGVWLISFELIRRSCEEDTWLLNNVCTSSSLVHWHVVNFYDEI